MRTIITLTVTAWLFLCTGAEAQDARWIDLQGAHLATSKAETLEERWRERLPADVSEKLTDNALVATKQVSYAGTDAKAGRSIEIIKDGIADKATSWTVASKSKAACNLQYVGLGLKIEGREN